MAINPEISLQVRPAQMPDPVQIYANALSLKTHQQQQQLQSQQLEEGALQLKQARDSMADDETIKRLYLENKGDLQATAKAAQGLVSPTKSRALAQLDLEDQTKHATLTNAQLDAETKKHTQLAGLLDGVKRTPAADRTPVWQNAISQALHTKLITPEEAATLPADPPDDDTLEAKISAYLGPVASMQRESARRTALSAEAQLKNQAADESRKAQTFPAQLSEAQAKAIQSAAGMLSSATDRAEYSAGYYRQIKANPDLKAVLPHPDTWTLETSKQLQSRGMTADQAAGFAQRAASEKRIANFENASLDLRNQQLALQRDRNNKADSVETRQAQTEIAKLQTQERELKTRQVRIAAAVQSGQYLNPAGKLEMISSLPPDQQAAAKADVEAQYRANADSMKDLIAAKYDQYARLGVTKPQYPLADVHQSIDDGTAKLFPGQKPTVQTGDPANRPQTPAQNPPIVIPGSTGPIPGRPGPMPPRPVVAPPPPAAAAPPRPAAAPPAAVGDSKSVVAALQKAGTAVSALDSADGFPIIEVQGKQYKITGVNADGTVKAVPGKWGPTK